MAPLTPANAFPTAVIGKVFLARARHKIAVGDLSMVLRAVAAARRQVGAGLLYWPVIEACSEMPPPDVRLAMQQATTTLLSLCESMTVIVLGVGVKASLMRTGIRGLSLVAGHRGKVRVVESLAAAVAAANDSSIHLAEIENAAGALGIQQAHQSAAV